MNGIDKTNNIMDHNDDIQHAAKAGGGAPPLWVKENILASLWR